MHARGSTSAVKTLRSSPGRGGGAGTGTGAAVAPSPSPSKKRQKVRSRSAAPGGARGATSGGATSAATDVQDSSPSPGPAGIATAAGATATATGAPGLVLFGTRGSEEFTTENSMPSELILNGTNNSQVSYTSQCSQSTFIEKMGNFNMMGKCSQSQNSAISYAECDFRAGCADGTRDGWEGMNGANSNSSQPIHLRPRLNFINSQDSGSSSSTIQAETSRDGCLNIFGGGDGSMILPPFGRNWSNSGAPLGTSDSNTNSNNNSSSSSNDMFKEPIESMSVSGSAQPPSSSGSYPPQNPFLPTVAPKAQPFGAPATPRPAERSIFDTKFDREFTVGCGAFAEVCVARNRTEGTIYAVKRVRAVITGARMQRRILHEVYALSVLRGCPNTIQYFDSWVDNGHLWICTDLCLKETVRSFLTYGKLLATGLGFFDKGRGLGEGDGGAPSVTPRFSALSYDEYESGSQLGTLGMTTLQRRFQTGAGTGTGAGAGTGAGPGLNMPRPLHRNLSTASNGGSSLETPLPGGYRISEDLAWVIIEQLGDALSFIHRNGIAHLDVKPGNIFIGVSSYFELESLYGRLRNVTEYSPEHYHHLAELEPKLVSGQWKLKLGNVT
jgi:hypothetical protein